MRFLLSEVPLNRRRVNMPHIRQSRPDSGLGFQVLVLKTLEVVPSSLRSGQALSPEPLLMPKHQLFRQQHGLKRHETRRIRRFEREKSGESVCERENERVREGKNKRARE